MPKTEPNDAPPTLAAHLRDADAAIATITSRVPGAKSATLHAIFCQAEAIKDAIVRESPPGQAAKFDHVDKVLQTSFFLVLAALGPVQPTNSEDHFASWWTELHGHTQLVELATERDKGVRVEDALDVLHRAKWEWTSFAARRIVADLLGAEFRDELEVLPRELIGVVEAVVSAAEIIVRECWQRD
ncbi:hypothetical protein CspHIS471_0203310 [Cutaneotrichosporon sp. HIS471]|nr:hypothetical protein CspHIS471_0203310 [Cutaneotrichosporon sp. HIS471]